MRHASLLLAAYVWFSCGCAYKLAGVGKDLGHVETKEEMHAILGQPVARGIVEGGEYEEFRTRKVIAEDQSLTSEGYAMLWISTWGAADLVLVPCQLCLLGQRTLL